MKHILRLFLLITLMGGFSGCIKNDIPHPTVKLQITSLELEGQTGSTLFNQEERTVTVQLEETVDLKSVLVKSVTTTEGTNTSLKPGSKLDLSSPAKVMLSLYQDYEWTIIGNQTIQRLFEVEGQIGESVFDPVSKRAVTYISPLTNPKTVTVLSLKLAPSGSSITPSDMLTAPQDFRKPREVMVTYRGVSETWTLFVEMKESLVTTKSANPWVNVVWLAAEGQVTENRGFEIREANASEWLVVDPAYITSEGTSFTARVPHLKAETAYIVRAYADSYFGEEITFVTGKGIALPNGSLDDWYQSGKVWNPWLEGTTQFWDTGNKGSSTLGESNSQPTSDIWPGKTTGQAAKLESKFVGIGSLGKFAAGNLFAGEFLKVDGTNGILNFGKPYSSFPTKLRTHYKYTTSPINYTSTEFPNSQGSPDSCFIYVAVGDWNEPIEIRTRPSNRKLFDKNDPHIIGYAEFSSWTTVNEYQELVLELDYRAKDRTPTYIVVVASASKWGDYFTGGTGSTLWVDEFSLEYDY